MSIIMIILVIIVVGILLWLVNTYIPMAAPIKLILNAVVIIGLIIWLLSVFGIINFHRTKPVSVGTNIINTHVLPS